jgi:hypothetical protein
LRATAQQSSEPDPIALAVIGIYRTITLFSENTLKIKSKDNDKKSPSHCMLRANTWVDITHSGYLFSPFF